MVKVKVTYKENGNSFCFFHKSDADAKVQVQNLRELSRKTGMGISAKIVK